MAKKIYLIDGNSFIYRMFFALPEFSTTSGKVVNATFGMAKFFTGQLIKEKPDYVFFIKDAKGDNFRHELYSEYKATRERMPDNLRSQISDIETMIQKMNIEIIEVPGFEADDVIATLAEHCKVHSQDEVYILSGDKDLYALVNEQVKIYDTQKKKIFGPDDTFEKFGVPPSCVRDYLAICGDSSDNIPGISGIGPKKATVLLNEFGGLDAIYNIIDNIDTKYDSISAESQKILKGKTLEKFIEGRENAFLSQKLATLSLDVDTSFIDFSRFEFHPKNIFSDEVKDFFREHEFHSLVSEVPEKLQTWQDLGKKVKIIGDDQGLIELSDQIKSKKEIVLDTETSSLNPREAQLIGVSILLSPDEIYYINARHSGPQVSLNKLQAFLGELLESNILIIGHNIKYDLQVIQSYLSKESSLDSKQEQIGFGF